MLVALVSVVIPPSATHIGINAFHKCSSLVSVVIPPSVTHIGDYAFADCSSLASVDISLSWNLIGANAFFGKSAQCRWVQPYGIQSQRLDDGQYG